MSNPENASPSERARIRLLTLIEHSDELGNVCAFDPWPLAEARRALEDEASPPRQWAALFDAFKGLDEAWTGPLMRSPRMQLMAASHCLAVKRDIEANDGGAVLEAVAQCAAHGLVMPAWLAMAYVARYQRVVTGQCRDWTDEAAFGHALPLGSNVAGVKARVTDGPWGYEVATELLSQNPQRPIDRGLYEEVGEVIGKKSHRSVF